MSMFTSSREKYLWVCVFAVFIAIFSTLFIGQPLSALFRDQNVQAAIFVFVMMLIGTTITIHGFKTKPSKIEITILLGIVSVYMMFFLRLGLSERSHLMEYSVLAIFIHKAIIERVDQGKQISVPALVSFIFTVIIGILDECIQIILPNRVFDIEDIVFNTIAASMAIGANVILTWIRKKRV